MKDETNMFHGSRYAITAALGAATTGLTCLQFSYLGLLTSVVVGMLCLIVVPYEQRGDN
jgi:uncharacterized protein (DUF697 family)